MFHSQQNLSEFNQLKCKVIVNLPPDSEDQDSDGVGAESGAALMAHCSAPLGSPGWDKHLVLVSEGRHSRMGWMDGNHLLNIDSEQGYRHRGHLDSLQALPTHGSREESYSSVSRE